MTEKRAINDMSIYERIEAGAYKNQVPYPASRKDKEAMAKYREGDRASDQKFWADVLEDCGIKEEDAFVKEMMRISWNHGHSCGHNDVYNVFTDLMELYNAR